MPIWCLLAIESTFRQGAGDHKEQRGGGKSGRQGVNGTEVLTFRVINGTNPR